MPRTLSLIIVAAFTLGYLAVAPAPAASAAAHDGNWSVLIITEKGDCERGFRYNVNISNGRVRYRGEASVDMTGTVAANGAVKVNLKLGDRGASGIGRLSANAGAGTWRGTGAGGDCAGRWEAERR